MPPGLVPVLVAVALFYAVFFIWYAFKTTELLGEIRDLLKAASKVGKDDKAAQDK